MLEISKGRRAASRDTEEDEAEEDEPRLTESHRGGSSLKLWTTLAVVAAGCGLTGSKEPWALGIVAALVALNLVIAPPRSAVPRKISWPLFFFALLSLGSFLPLRESAVPGWRKTWMEDFGVDVGGLRSPQPWASLETWIAIAIGLIWLWHCLGRGFNESERRWLVRMLALLVTVIAILAVWVKRAGIVVPFWQRLEWNLGYFGPFPNRNNFGGLLAMGAVLTFAAAYDSFRRRSGWWPLYALTLAPIVLAMVGNTSRAGIGLFFLGLVAWVAFASFSKRSAQRMGVAAAILLALVAVVILFGQHILQRMSLTGFNDQVGGSMRLHLWSDCLAMIAKVPLFGIGLGCFDAVFPFYQTHFDTLARNIHPESDWSWIAVEAGVPAVLFLIVALVSYIRRTGLWRGNSGKKKSRRDQRLRNACAVAALILPLHAFVDTPAHQPGLVCFASLLAGLSLRARRDARDAAPSPSWKTRWLFAGFCGLASAAWFAIAAGIPALPGTTCSKMLEREADRLIDKGDLAAAKSALNRAIAMKPMHHYSYSDRAALSLARGLPPQSALEDFARMRFLEPHVARICKSEADVWLRYYPAYAPAAWREAMRRDIARADDYYVDGALAALREHPEIRRAVSGLATTPRQKLGYISTCGPKEIMEAIADLLEANPTLENFSPDERLRLFNVWFATGDRDQLINRLEQDATWRANGWPVLAQGRAARADFRGAYQLALEYLPPPATGSGSRNSDLAQLRRDFLFHPTDFNYGFALFEAESSKGLISDGLVTLEKVAQLPNAPIRVLYEQAVLLSRKGDHAAAWEKMKAYIEKWQVDRRDSPASVTRSDESAIKADVTRLLRKTEKKR